MKQAFLSILRHILTFGGGLVVANNPSITDASASTVIGGIMAVIGASVGAYDEYKATRK
jgi:hypothetical protein